jgi:hypothetical protein
MAARDGTESDTNGKVVIFTDHDLRLIQKSLPEGTDPFVKLPAVAA